MTSQEWIERRASEMATEKEEKARAEGTMAVIEWSKIFFLAMCEYLDKCGVKPCEINESGDVYLDH